MTVYVIANGERAGLIVSDVSNDNLPDLTTIEYGETTLALDGSIAFIAKYPDLFKVYRHAFTRHGGKKYGGLRWWLGKTAFNLKLTKTYPDYVQHVVEGSNKPLLTFGLPDWENRDKSNLRTSDDMRALLLYAVKTKTA